MILTHSSRGNCGFAVLIAAFSISIRELTTARRGFMPPRRVRVPGGMTGWIFIAGSDWQVPQEATAKCPEKWTSLPTALSAANRGCSCCSEMTPPHGGRPIRAADPSTPRCFDPRPRSHPPQSLSANSLFPCFTPFFRGPGLCDLPGRRSLPGVLGQFHQVVSRQASGASVIRFSYRYFATRFCDCQAFVFIHSQKPLQKGSVLRRFRVEG